LTEPDCVGRAAARTIMVTNRCASVVTKTSPAGAG
jgi:hypothetical protein